MNKEDYINEISVDSIDRLSIRYIGDNEFAAGEYLFSIDPEEAGMHLTLLKQDQPKPMCRNIEI